MARRLCINSQASARATNPGAGSYATNPGAGSYMPGIPERPSLITMVVALSSAGVTGW